MASKYQEYNQLNLPQIEKDILAHWEEIQAFEKSVSIREGATPFVFYEGPPSANGMPGIHHVISRTLKDLVCRYKTMNGFQVKRKGGWDTHGLPVELGVEKMLGITKEAIGKTISIEDYNKACRTEVLKFKDKWDDLTRKMGYWVDLKSPYITFDNNYIESLWWCLSELYKKNLLYKSVSIQPYSPAAGTGLSSHELNMPGCYKEVKDTTVVAMFKTIEADNSAFLFEAARKIAADAEVFFMAWTTTPWTLPSNLGLTVGANIEYTLVRTFNPYTHLPQFVVMAKDLLGKYFKKEGEDGDFAAYNEGDKVIPWQILSVFKGSQLENIRYEQLLPYVQPESGDPFRVLLGDFVTTEDGTGIVHTAPAFGADDYRVGQKYDIGILTLVDRQGKFLDEVGEFGGRYVKNYKSDPEYKDVDVDISVKLKKENRAFKVEKYEHTYPHCWRTDKPVLYYPLDAWFIRTTAVKDKMVELNKTINWKPATTGTGRFGNWLENMVDWNLSRSRFWGTPLPVWRTVAVKEDSPEGAVQKCLGAKNELLGALLFVKKDEFKADVLNADSELSKRIATHNAQYAGKSKEEQELYTINIDKVKAKIQKEEITLVDLALANWYLTDLVSTYCVAITEETLGDIDLHKPMVDNLIFDHEGQLMYREPDLVDVWFDSGAMPYAQWHYPFDNKEEFAKSFPADFIAEGVDQTRGWFYTLHALGTMLFDSVAYKTVVSNGLVLDKNGVKMSKRLGNIVDPFATLEQFGADATRWYLVTNASPWDSMKFDIDGIREVQRKLFSTLYNTYNFFAMYANLDKFTFSEAYVPLEERPEIDRWIISLLNTLVKDVTGNFDDYEPTQAGRAIQSFVDEHLSNWYVRLCRRRFWKGEYAQDKISAYQTLYECLETLARLMAPVSPFFADWLFGNLNKVSGRHGEASVHHMNFPSVVATAINADLEERMQLAQDISSLVLSLRKKVNIKVRQPLQKILIPVQNLHIKEQIEKIQDLIKSEVNVKGIEYLTETEGFIKKKIKPNYKSLGGKMGAKMKAVAAAISAFSAADIASLERNGEFILQVEDEQLPIQLSDVEIISEDIPGWTVANKGALTVALDITITPALLDEGNARELVNRIQKIRKDNDFELTDRIQVKVAVIESLKSAIINYNDYICTEILADSLELVPELQDGTEIEVNDLTFNVLVNKKANPMATSKKVASKKTQKAVAPAKKAAAKQVTPAKKSAAAKPAAKKVAVAAKPAAKTSTPKVATKQVKPTTTQKVVAKKSAVTQTASSSKSVVKKAPVAAQAVLQTEVKKATAPAKPAASAKVPDTKKVVTPSVTADKEKLISKPEEKEVIMPVNKKDDKEKVVAKDAKKPADKVQKAEKTGPAAKAERPADRTEKVEKKGASKAATLVTYQPEFTKSVLDQPEQPSGPVYRYSDTDLQEFKDLILKKLEAAKKELVYLQGLITRKDEAGTDDTENKYMSMEDGSGSQEREQLNQMASRQIQFIDHLEKALVRIENKTYGICRVTGKLIDKARLRAVPHATLSIEAKLAKSK